MSLYIGLMSGTSMDGIDAVLVDISPDRKTQRLIHGITQPYSAEVKKALEQVLHASTHSLRAIYQLNTLIGRDFAQAANTLLKQAGVSATAVEAIGSHGQTLEHDASSQGGIPYTVQLGCPHTIAELTKVAVVADFRTRDLVLGGQGAPLAPLYHQALFSHLGSALAVVNIGGIANVSYLLNNQGVSGFDVGPGNCLMDAWCMSHRGKPYDERGEWASEGKVIEPLLHQLLADPFFHKSGPKSIGKEYFSMPWLSANCTDISSYNPQDVQATLLQLTAHTIAQAIAAGETAITRLLVCGGGAHNTQLLAMLSQLLPTVRVESTAAVSVDPNFVEAQMMAWLAHQMIIRQPLDLTTITGSTQKAILGVFYPAGIDK